MTHYILVHGAWEGPWSWDYTRPALEKHGHIVTAIDLHGRDGSSRNVTNVTLSSYVETVVNAIDQLDHTVVLVGHSMAGAVISQVEDRLSKVLPLVDVGQATEPFMAKVVVTDKNFGSVPKLYIRTALDKMVSPKLQDEMLKNWKVDQVHVLQSGHFPTLSMPETLAELML